MTDATPDDATDDERHFIACLYADADAALQEGNSPGAARLRAAAARISALRDENERLKQFMAACVASGGDLLARARATEREPTEAMLMAAFRIAMYDAALSEPPPEPEERGKVWPFAELPGELAARIEGYLRENGGYVLGALRHAFIEEPARILPAHDARARVARQLATYQPAEPPR